MTLKAIDLLRHGAPRPVLMGILNVTPDSFSDGGKWDTPECARHHAVDLCEQGADIIDMGAESTRPGAEPVTADSELSRLIPALEAVLDSIDKPVSVDTMKASVARRAVEKGAAIINDVSGLADPEMAAVAAELGVPLVVMSSYGTPETYKTQTIPGDAVTYALGQLRAIVSKALDAGVKAHNIIVDPGVGFGTSPEQAVEMISCAGEFSMGKYPVLIGPSRKRFLAKKYPGLDTDEATAEACLLAVAGGADIVRVHDVACVARRF